MKKETEKVRLEVGQEVNINICEPTKGKFPIGRYEGMICKLILPETIKFVPYGCTVYASVTEVKEKCYVVTVIEIIKSPAVNSFEANQKIGNLKDVMKVTTQVKKVKTKKYYPYLSKNELETKK